MKKLTIEDGKTPDLKAQNIEKLKELFPEFVGDETIDFDAFKETFGEYIDDREERYSFTWHGKSRARRMAQMPSSGTLLPCPEESANWDDTQNIFIEGDNLEVLKLLQKSYHRKVKMIYIDPPYNTGKEFIYPDRFQDNLDTYLKYTGQVDEDGFKLSANVETGGRYHTNWLNMMYPRLKLARNLLRDDGVIFVSIDDHEAHNLRHLMDELFGPENFVAHIIWQHSVQPKGYTGIYSVHHNHVLSYRRTDEYEIQSLERTAEDNKAYGNPDNDPKGDWRTGDVRNALYRPNLRYDITTPSGNKIKPPANGWRWSKTTLAEKISVGEIVFSDDETRIIKKIYLANLNGRTPETIWFGKDTGVTRDGAKELKDLFGGKVPFDTVKPLALVDRMMRVAGIQDDDIVLDFFAGSCTTAHAVMRSGEGRFIAVQLPEPVDASLPHGKAALSLGLENVADVAMERIRRAAQKISSGLIGSQDIGVQIFKLSSSNIKPWDADFDDLDGALIGAIENIKPDRNQEDVLYELLLKYGLDLATPTTERTIARKKVFIIGAGALVVCLEDGITLKVVRGIADLKAELKPEIMRVVFKDSGFKDDVVKTNTVQILKQAGVDDVKSL